MTLRNGKYVVWLRTAGAEDISRMGSKAANLARLLKAGYPVPEGFCITSDAYVGFLASLEQPIHAGIATDDLLKRFLSAGLDPDLESEVLEAYHFLRKACDGETKVAVRSSAFAEDSTTASFAGQYTSILNVDDERSLREAIKACWASSHSPQIGAYQERAGKSDEQPNMGVIVQWMVQGEMAGVLFTSDPVNGNNTQMVLELGLQSGADVVSGKETGIRLTADKQSLDTVTVHSSPENARGVLPKDVDWSQLLKTAARIEILMGAPQDIEWVFREGRFWILQSRPITAAFAGKPRHIWSRANAGEIMPGVVSPLTWSVFKPVLQAAGQFRAWSPLTLHWRWTHPCGTWPDSPQLFKGRAYMELATVYAGFGSLPGVTSEILQRLLGFEFDRCREKELPRRTPRWHVMDPYRYLRFWAEMIGATKSLSGQAKQWMYPKKWGSLERLHNVSDVALRFFWDEMEQLFEESSRILGLHIQCTSMAFSAFGLLDHLLRKHFESKDVLTFEANLIADFQQITTVQQGIAIWDLAQAAQKEQTVRDAILNIDSADRLMQTLASDPTAGDFLAAWNSFLDRFGDRGTQEFELAVPHWAEDPSFITKTIQQIIQNEPTDPRKRLDEQHRNWNLQYHATGQLLRSRGFLKDAWLFRRFVKAYREFVPLRENLKYCVVGRFHILRKTFVNLGKLLEETGVLPNCNDIFYLRYEEIAQLFKQPHPGNGNVHNLIRTRRELHKMHMDAVAPDLWIIVDCREIPMEVSAWQETGGLQGIGCSPGVITGRAHVLTSNIKDVVIPPGCILVVPSIDPGLTPLFLTASGLVTEIGGVLSHGATVARELGLPAVVGVPHATRVIKNGQQIQVDGFTGRIHLNPIKN